jgi:hypothetical protein
MINTREWSARATIWDKVDVNLVHWIAVRPKNALYEEMTIKENRSMYYLLLFILTPVITGKSLEANWD